jgi:putative PIN family toxin of toxin-antitoxin system
VIRAVIDSNVVVSALLGWDRSTSAPAAVLHRVVAGECAAILSAWIIDEIERTLEEPVFVRRLGPERVRELLAIVYAKCEVHDLTVSVSGVAPDPDDDPIIAAALSGDAAYIVTGDRALRSIVHVQGVTIVTPREFLEIF